MVLQQRWTTVPCAALSKASRSKWGDSSFQLSTGEGTSGVLCLLLGSSVQKRYGVCGKRAANGHENVEGTGASSVRREVERAGTVYISVYRHLTWERTKEDGDRIFSLVSSDRTRVKGTSCNVGNSM